MVRVERKAITTKMKIDALLDFAWQTGAAIYCLECGDPILPGETIQWDHRHATVHEGPHTYRNLRPVHYDPCHKLKTRRDIQANAKVKRIAKGGRTRKGPPMKGRGFDKSLSRKMSGEVVRR